MVYCTDFLQAKLVLTSAVPLQNLFLTEQEVRSLSQSPDGSTLEQEQELAPEMRNLMDDLGLSMSAIKSSPIFTGDEERFAFARALSRLAEMGSQQWVERGLGVGMNVEQGRAERDAWTKTRSRWSEDSM